jgi:hypothetical protein
LIYSGFFLVDTDLRVIGRIDPPRPELVLRNTLFLEGPPVMLSSTGLFSRKAFDALGGFDERLTTSADCDFVSRLVRTERVVPVNEPLALYRLHPGQMHIDPVETEHDVAVIYDKFFTPGYLPAPLNARRRRAVANLNLSLAGRYWTLGERRTALTYLCRVLTSRPDRLVGLLRLLRPHSTVRGARWRDRMMRPQRERSDASRFAPQRPAGPEAH